MTSRGLSTGSLAISGDRHRLSSNELRFHLRLAILQEHRDDLLQVRVELVKRGSLAVGAREPGNVPDVQSGVRAVLNDRSERPHIAPHITAMIPDSLSCW